MTIRVAINKRLIEREHAARSAARRARRQGAPADVSPKVELRYKRMYFNKLLGLAARPPFQPKKIDYTLFYDPIMNRAGLTDCIPKFEECNIEDSQILPDKYTLDDYEKQKDTFIEKNILRSYLLKRPEIRFVSMEEVYLPYWVCTYSPEVQILINAATGKANI